MNALSKTKCTRIALILGLCLLLAGPALLIWASRVQLPNSSGDNSPDANIEQIEAHKIASVALPPATRRPAEFSPFGEAFKNGPARVTDATGYLRMNLGDLDPKNPDAFLSRIPVGLRHNENERIGLGPKGTLAPGLVYAMLRPLEGKSLDAVMDGIRQDARIINYGANSTLLLYVEAGSIGKLRGNADIAFFQAMPPGDKISLDTGRRPLIYHARALDPQMLLEVALVPGTDFKAAREAISRVPGVSEATEYGPGGSSLLVKANYKALARLARVNETIHIQESLEMMATNAKNAPTMQVGSLQESNGARPFDDLGVDGGGIDTNGDGQRVNNGTDTVPPQLVGVLDNGISADTPSFSQTATQVSDLSHAYPNPVHRKVHSILSTQSGDLFGEDCDSPLDGAGSHGNVVASVIAAYPTQVGATLTRIFRGFTTFGSARNVNLNGIARGARIIVSDIANNSLCKTNSLVERGGNVDPGSLATRLGELICPLSGGTGICASKVGGANMVHLAVTPFGAPDNFSTDQFQDSDGTYPIQSADVDTFLYNNKDFTVVGPAGNSGVLISTSRAEFWTPRVIPDDFNGTNTDDCIAPACDPGTYVQRPIQIPPPSTAKNMVVVGVTRSDEMTVFDEFDNMANMATFSSRGPATHTSRRMAPIVVAPGSDLIPGFEAASMAVFRSNDNTNSANKVDQQLDEGNFGTSFAAAAVTGGAALIRDYFAQGLYPSGDRIVANRVPNVSGALVKAALVASARFTTNIRTPGETAKSVSDKTLRRTRGFDAGTIAGINVGVIGNSEQGYGRVVLTNVLPMPNWADNTRLGGVGKTGNRWTAGNTPPGPAHWEHPAQGLLIWDDIATGEPVINNSNISKTHTFRVASPVTVGSAGSGLAAGRGQIRVAVAWTDPPSAPGSGGDLTNDLDLVVESPGPDNCIGAGDTRPDGVACLAGTDADNRFYDGNVYGSSQNPFNDQWSKVRTVGQPEIHDKYDPQEAVHLSFDPNNDTAAADSSLFSGTWRVTVKRGLGGSTPGSITVTGPMEDANGNRRLDPGEDGNGNGLLDLNGQSYALVVAGPVYLAEAAPTGGPQTFPSSSISLDKTIYGCNDSTAAAIFDTTAGAGPSRSNASTTFTVRDAAGNTIDSETNISFAAGAAPGSSNSANVPVRQVAGAPTPGNGILEADSGMLVVATYAPAGQLTIAASGKVDCNPQFVPGFFALLGNNVIGPQNSLTGGCDNDGYLDANEIDTYGVALANRGHSSIQGSSSDDYPDVVATLTASGPGAGAITILDSPLNIGRMPEGSTQAAYFHIKVDQAASNALSLANRKVTLTLTLDSTNKGRLLSKQSYTFNEVINADRETKHYSTDFKSGGRQVRDLNRNLVIDRPDVIDPVRLFFLPDEDVTFSTLFVAGAPGGLVSNVLGEDLDNSGGLNGQERDLIPNGTLDRGLLFSATGPNSADKIPWNFDSGNGGWVPIRHPQSNRGLITPNPMWEYKTGGVCGFQTAGGAANQYGIWHTGDGDVTTPLPASTACDNYLIANDPNTEAKVEFVMDVLHSPIIAKVNQVPDSRGFSWGVEFQRLAMNVNDEVLNGGYTPLGITIDNNLEEDVEMSIFGQELDVYYIRGSGGWMTYMFNLAASQPFAGAQGIDPNSDTPYQRTFGPLNDPNAGSPFDGGGESGFSGFISVPTRSSPIPPADANYQKFPQPASPVPGVCSGGTNPGGPCQTSTDCAGGGTCTLEGITIAGPVRNLEFTLVGYEGGFSVETLVGQPAPENVFGGFMGFNPGPSGGNRWAIAMGFSSIETTTPADTRDYGYAVDDVVFEWDEYHPVNEQTCVGGPTPGAQCATNADCGAGGTCTGGTSACSRFNSPGNPSGGQCATLTVDRSFLYECEESVQISVFDPKIPAAASVPVKIVTDSDSDLFSTSRFTVFKPNAKSYSLPAVAGQPGLYRGNVTFSGTSNTPNNVFTTPGQDAQFIVYYVDTGCDGDRDGQANETNFDNLDGDNVADAVDNCPLIYNPLQEDGDGDGHGNLCDNCVTISNANQADADADGVGDACEYDDVDGDGVSNSADNCKDVYNPTQQGFCVGGTPGPCLQNGDCTSNTCDLSRGFPCSSNTSNLDGDGRTDNIDNCVLTANSNQNDLDGDGLGDSCDGDCASLTVVRICSNAPLTVCTSNTDCPAGGFCQTEVRHAPAANCSTVNDDVDVDAVADNVDDCPGIYNATIIPGSQPPTQLDTDRDGLGDACDPAGTLDDEFDGIPDDLVSFTGTVFCQQLPLGNLSVLQATYQDIDGDHDPFPDSGETGLVTLKIQNNANIDLTGASFILTASDPDVDCITFPKVVLPAPGLVPAGGTVNIGSLVPLQAGSSFTFRTSNATTSTAGNTAHIDLCVTVNSNEVLGGSACFSLLADLNIPGGGQTFILGPDGNPNTGDDGLLREQFDIDRNGDGHMSTADTFRQLDSGTGLVGTGQFWHGSVDGIGSNVMAGIGCGGYLTAAEGNPECRLDTDYPMDWHFHCRAIIPGGEPDCPNTESGGFGAKGPACVGGCSYNTPADGTKAFSPPNSLHLGAHFDTGISAVGDTTHLRALQAFVTNPINLAVIPRDANDLKLSFWHINDLIDGNAVSGGVNLCHDCSQVQIQVDQNPAAGTDQWGVWDTLVPFQNIYRHTVRAWSTFGGQYCELTPTDTGTAPPAPRGVHELMCFNSKAWGHCGSARGTGAVQTFQCANGVVDPGGTGVWVQSKFNLDPYLGQRVRIRWMTTTWQFDDVTSSYFEYGTGWSDTPHDDGWWLDNIDVTGVVTSQVTPTPDPKPAPATACPATAADNCNENAAASDKGTNVVLKVTDAQGTVLDGSTLAKSVTAGHPYLVSALDSTLPGACAGGGAQFQFTRNGVVVQDWNSKSYFQDTSDVFAEYSVKMRCSSDFSCTSQNGKVIDVAPYRGDGDDFQWAAQSGIPLPNLGVRYYRGVCGAATIAGSLCGGGNVPIAIGAIPPCNIAADCAVFGAGACSVAVGAAQDAAGVGNDQTLLCWTKPPAPAFVADIYHGVQGPSISKGQQGCAFGALPPAVRPGGLRNVFECPASASSNWVLNTNDATGALAALGAVSPPWATCFDTNAALPAGASPIVEPDIPPTPAYAGFPALYDLGGIGVGGGVLLGQIADPNVPATYSKYYDGGIHAGPNVGVAANWTGFARPMRCSMNSPANPGGACFTAAANCGGAPGVCLGAGGAPVQRQIPDYNGANGQPGAAPPAENLCP